MTVEEFKLHLASEIKRLRESKGITRNQFFLTTNIQIGRIEDGYVIPTLSTYFIICENLDISLDEMLKNIEYRSKTAIA